MHWLVENINHFMLPMAMVLSLFSIASGLHVQRKRKQGVTGPFLSGGAMAGAILILMCCAVLLGIAFARNWA